MNRSRHTRSVLVFAMLLAACGSKTDDAINTAAKESVDTTTADGAEDATTTTAAPTTTVDEGTGVEDLPPACIAEIKAVLLVFEPSVKDIDWEHATIDDHLMVMTSLAGSTMSETTSCEDRQPDLTEDEGAELFFAVAEQEVPATVGYFKSIVDINKALGGRKSVGECLPDIATFEELVAGGVPYLSLPLPEQWLTLNLMFSIGYCQLQTQGALLSKPEVRVFLEGSGFG